MNSIIPIEPVYSEPVLGILLTVIVFIIYWFASKSKGITSLLSRKFGEEQALFYKVLIQKVSGFLFLGIIPALIISISPFSFSKYGINSTNAIPSLYWVLSLGWAIFLLSYFISKQPNNYKNYPQIRLTKWSYKTVLLNSFSWLIYLLGYEFIFRGVLLFSCLDTFDISTSIAINVALYSIAHIPKGLMETVGSIPIGTLLCYITISTGSIWAAVILHLTIALSNDYVALYYNPEMKLVNSNKR